MMSDNWTCNEFEFPVFDSSLGVVRVGVSVAVGRELVVEWVSKVEIEFSLEVKERS